MLTYKRAQEILATPPPPRLATSKRHLEGRENLLRLVEMTRSHADRGLLMFVEFQNEMTGHWAFVHPSARYHDKFRWTSFIEDGWWGHYDEFDSPEEAFFDMVYSGYDVMDVGALKRAMEGPLWPKYAKNPFFWMNPMEQPSYPSPWDEARTVQLTRVNQFGEPELIDQDANFFVLALEQLGAVPLASCGGHPGGFYILFRAPYRLALRIAGAGYFTLEIARPQEWAMRYTSRAKSLQEAQWDKGFTLRTASVAWVRALGLQASWPGPYLTFKEFYEMR